MIHLLLLTMHFNFAVPQTTAAFGPVAESQWSPDFRPAFVRPVAGRDVEGAVFRTPDGGLWLVHDFRPQQGHVQYVISDQAALVVLDIVVTAEGLGHSKVVFSYDIVPLDARGADHRARIGAHLADMRDEMQKSVSAYLSATPAARP